MSEILNRQKVPGSDHRRRKFGRAEARRVLTSGCSQSAADRRTANFLPTRTVYVERVSGVGEAVAQVPTGNASLGIRIGPGPVGSGLTYRLGVERGYLLPSYHTAIEETVPVQLKSGPYGWQVIDCSVTVIHSRFSAPRPPAGYFRTLTAEVVCAALAQAGTVVCAPVSEFDVEFPETTLSPVLRHLHAHGATPHPPVPVGARRRITGVMPTDQVAEFEQRLPGLTGGEGVFDSRPAGYEPVHGPPPRR